MGESSIGFKHLDDNMKAMVTLLTLCALIVPCVLGFVNFDKRIDLVEVFSREEAVDNEKLFDRLTMAVDENEDSIHSLELIDMQLTVQYQEILKNQTALLRSMDNLTRAE